MKLYEKNKLIPKRDLLSYFCWLTKIFSYWFYFKFFFFFIMPTSSVWQFNIDFATDAVVTAWLNETKIEKVKENFQYSTTNTIRHVKYSIFQYKIQRKSIKTNRKKRKKKWEINPEIQLKVLSKLYGHRKNQWRKENRSTISGLYGYDWKERRYLVGDSTLNTIYRLLQLQFNFQFSFPLLLSFHHFLSACVTACLSVCSFFYFFFRFQFINI